MSKTETSQSSSPLRRRPLPAALIVAMRPKQWSKNLLLFAGLLFTLDTHHAGTEFRRAILGFAFFSLLSSVVYLINDILDRESDRLHPRKRHRPIANGDLSPTVAGVAAVALLIGGLFGCAMLSYRFAEIALFYFCITLAYSFHFKHVVLLDVMVLAAGFVLRAIAGAVVIGVSISPWLVLCTLMLALFLALSKRRAELISIQQSGMPSTRRILDEYSAGMLDQMIVIVTSACVMSYSLYTIESQAASRHHYLMATIPFVIYGIFRYLYLMHRHSLGESPDSVLLEDRPMLVNILLWGLVTGLIITHTLDRWMEIIPR